MKSDPLVVVIDDDPGARNSVENLLRSVGLRVKALSRFPERFSVLRSKDPSCLVLDVRMPGQSGLDIQKKLSDAKMNLPIVFISAHADVRTSVRAMKEGAVEFLAKPFSEQDLLDAVNLALEKDRAWLEQEKTLASLRARYENLSFRERQVMHLVLNGRLNKQIAADIGISEATVKLHRGHVMSKMEATSLPDLARMAEKLDSPLPQEEI